MNEITKIHLGRQAFTISVDAHKALQKYLHDIEHESSKDLATEVELRMAELLTERGIGKDKDKDKVIVLEDVTYLKDQLGEPGDFKDDDSKNSADSAPDAKPVKRLFRDTERGMVAGVAAGIAAYLKIDPVVVRLLFVLATVTGGWGIAVYIVMWLIVPEAKTSSDALLMRGRAVTVDSLKEIVDRADVKGAATRAGGVLGSIVNTIGKTFLTILGAAFVAAGAAILFGLTTGGVYWGLNHDKLIPYGIFPVGVAESLLVPLAIVVCVMLATLFLLVGVSMVRRKWQLPGWGVAALLGIMFACLAVGGALGGDAAPKVRDRFEAAHHSDIRTVQPFTEVTLVGDENAWRMLEVVRRNAAEYKVEIRYLGKADLNSVTVKQIKEGAIEVNTANFKGDPRCTSPCIFADRDIQVIVYAPAGVQVQIDSNGTSWTTIPGLDLVPVIRD